MIDLHEADICRTLLFDSDFTDSVFEGAEQNKEYAKEKLEIPILTIGGEAAIGNFTTTSFQKVANNVTGITLPNTGHFILKERPSFLTKQVLDFFNNSFLSYFSNFINLFSFISD